jgi:hypothetical protein
VGGIGDVAVTPTVVISGAVTVAAGDAPTPLLSVPEVAELAIAHPDQEVALVIHNRTAAPLKVTGDGAGDVIVAADGSVDVPFAAAPEGARLHLLILPADRSRAVTVIVTVEPSEGGPVAVGQAIGGPGGVVLSASKDLEPGVRAMLLLADDLFRLDIAVVGDALQTFVRNLTSGDLELHGEVGQPRIATTTLGLAARYAPGRADLRFAVGPPDARADTEVTIATLRFAERGLIRVSAQGIVRPG